MLSNQALAIQVGRAIARHRVAKQLTQHKLAEAIGIGPEAMSRIERGKILPPLERLIRLAELLDCKTVDLLDETSPNAQDQAQHLHRLLAQLKQADRDMVMDVVTRLVEGLSKR
ncbi:helix-turn-helix domain-containing protein [Chitinimonas taiwanensis]|uniref:helix-turn-helix domain-containing protein n=1 Tax=Chitinimonas taiwanensis TaxID=240412 RepID=UPI0035B121D9